MKELLIFYAIGVLIWTIGYYIYYVYSIKEYTTKKLILYKGFTSGIILHWIGIIFMIAFCIVGGIALLDDKIQEKLSK